MRLSIENVGKIKNADIEINSITVIGGENNTGKSTIGKSLWTVFSSFYNIDEKINESRFEILYRFVRKITYDKNLTFENRKNLGNVARRIVHEIDFDNSSLQEVSDIVLKELLSINGLLEKDSEYPLLVNEIERLCNALLINREDALKISISNTIRSEFRGYIKNVFANALPMIKLQIKDKYVKIHYKDREILLENDFFELSTEAVYYDNPFLLESCDNPIHLIRNSYLNHEEDLIYKLIQEENVDIISENIQKELTEQLLNKINDVVPGEIVFKNREIEYKFENKDVQVNVRNLSTGFKAFAIIKKLLTLNKLEYNGVLILDEPESHLHPAWQIRFAEIIVLLQQVFHLHILLNTHSPYFLRAIELYCANYKIKDVKYYLSNLDDDGYAYFKDVGHETDKIYQLLAEPFQTLEDLRYDDD